MSVEPLICELHGEMAKGGITHATIDAGFIMFCPVCGCELIPESEVGTREPRRSQAEYAEHYDGDILRMPTVRLDGKDTE